MMKRFLCLLLCVSVCSSLARPVKAVTTDYLNITLADIIIAWYNASGTAIGDTNLVDAIYDAYGSITIDDLVENNCFFVPDLVLGTIAPDSPEMHDYIRQLIGYGNLTVPMIQVRVNRLREYLSGYPLSDVAREALIAMFHWEGNEYNESMFALLGMAIGSVANIGKLGYQLAVEVITNVSEDVKNSYLGKTLLDVYRHFTDTTYFQDLLDEGIEVPGTPGGGGSLPLNFDAGDYAGIGGIADFFPNGTSTMFCLRLPEHVFGFVYRRNGNTYFCVYNNTSSTQIYEWAFGSASDGSAGDWHRSGIDGNTLSSLWTSEASSIGLAVGGYAIKNDSGVFPDGGIYAYCRDNDPWGGGSSSTVTGVTKYINNAVGNILSDNYLNLSPNIGSDEYMYIFDRPTYIETLNQITNNTDNGDYSDNSTVINNFNETNIQEPDYVTVRPSTAPADPDQPAQPFISPRPTQAPDSFEGVIYEGGISEEITKKFPFCIPWDIKAMIDRLWTPESRAPYIHWDANFGSWGNLGEVDIDLKDFNGVAAIFRSTTLLLWIVWLVIVTRDLLG